MDSTHDLNRRNFLKRAAILGAAPLFPGGRELKQQPQAEQVPSGVVPKKQLGQTGVQVSALGLGGYHLGSVGTDRAALEIVAKALDHGINFFDNCWEYQDGLSEERLGKALQGKRDTRFL